ncbi:protein of unknown function (plasmid) [Azospirillum baldaniorum]|uniref:Uncharacterized protein n=1 Tax=Azospirillum baldaniorum TaxID=1064539 RepID=A0A9P1JV38_9PROT|nr:protein of unknown function [Azospirillum baldaniorum]
MWGTVMTLTGPWCGSEPSPLEHHSAMLTPVCVSAVFSRLLPPTAYLKGADLEAG